MRLLGIAITALGVATSALAAAEECDVYFAPHSGTEIAALPAQIHIPENSQVRLLSDGAKNLANKGNFGQTYLVIPGNANPYALKIYTKPWELTRDLDALTFLETKVLLNKDSTSFRVATARPTEDPHIMRLSYARGRDLNMLLGDPLVPASLKEHLLQDYLDRLKQLADKVKSVSLGLRVISNGHNTDVFLARAGEGEPEIALNINQSQVIVDPETLEMTIVDPY